ncbi:PRC-barrel domain-containing protein [Bradyrhizobium sp. 83012]|uniref:PRC-barrel domain-containing protein n=1 Tax=Bradyrhizobium aeschynomenes TaxID=2734909 RepID=A0ABX2C6P8_9BRAD|nr:PRC-barrel domain-containing protein [Bradyrhizobium aeschynomenes]NPU13133.1 PRC-barrel domain-containing protein [Bradyrhizobium aeschynomenes]NPU63653.1 PRC-barrel domain-containing protein [Bradyrhizobium aeschynomenes]NPV19346.1 PRC-barrel domain-containing protein [Bradyrhizobium aeschynomenes]
MRNLTTALALTALASTAAFAESASQAPAANQSGRQDIVANLQQSGFTNVRVISAPTVIQAKDRSGNPIMVFVGANAMDEPATVGANTGASAGSGSDAAPGGAFTSVPAKDGLGSRVIGLDVFNMAKQNIGTIKDIAFNENGVDGYILSVGGFLGIGDQYVAVRPSAIKIKYDQNDRRWHASMDTTAEQLKAAPSFKYPSNM